MFVSSIVIVSFESVCINEYLSLKKYFPMRPQGNATSLLLRTVPSIATDGMELPRSLIVITGLHVDKLPDPRTLPLSCL